MNPAIQTIYESNSWNEFEEKINKFWADKNQLYAEAFEWLCIFFLQIHPVYRCSYKKVLHRDDFMKSYEIKKKLGLHYYEKLEQGVDGILETFDGKIVAIQCKYKKKTNKNLIADDLNDILRVVRGKNAKKYVDTILMCSNAKGITRNKNLRNEFDGEIKSINYDQFKKLDKIEFDQIREIIDKNIPKYLVTEAKEHQKIAVNKTLEYFKNNSRGKLIHCCGSGKTLTSFLIFKEMNLNLTVFVVPGLQLVRQTLLAWTRESLAYNLKITPLLICSDKSNEKLEYEPFLWLEDIGIKVSNKFDDFKNFIKKESTKKVIFCTYQSANILIRNCKESKTTIDLAIFDEAHNTVTKRTKLFSKLLDDNNLVIKKRLFMTATPKNFIGKKEEVCSMDNEDIYGEEIDEFTIKDAIEIKILNDYKILTPKITSEECKTLIRDNPYIFDKKRKLSKEVELKIAATSLLLDKIIFKKKLKNLISFHALKSRASNFSEIVNQLIKDLNTFYVNGKQSITERNNILEEFTLQNPSIVSNARCLSEGVNLPLIDGVVFVDPKQSKVAITQSIGRALRRPVGKKEFSYIIVPTIIDEKEPEKVEDAYEQIFLVLRALAEHDGRIVDYIKSIKTGKKPQKKFIEDDSEYSSVEINLEKFNEELAIRTWDKISKIGIRTFEDAKEYIRSKNLQSSSEFRTLMKSKERPIDIPIHPERKYKEWISWYDFLGTKTEEEKFEDFLQDFIDLAETRDNKEIPYFPSDDVIGPRGVKIGQIWRSLIYWKGEDPLNKKGQIKQRLNGICVLETRDDWIREEKMRIYAEWRKDNINPYPPKNLFINGFDLYDFFHIANGKMKNYEKEKTKGMQIRKGQKGVEEALKLKKLGFPFVEKKKYIWNIKFIEIKNVIVKNEGIPSKIFKAKTNNSYLKTWVDVSGKPLKFKFDGTNMKGWYEKKILHNDDNWADYPEREEPTKELREILNKYSKKAPFEKV
tara:strand:+ start:294 stop:3224 length:2931 start_codon:yes stop_codon:yes gene_type:complete